MLHLTTWLLARLPSARRPEHERGAVAIEYGVLAGTVAFVLIGFVTLFFTGLGNWFVDLVTQLPGIPG